MTLCDTGPIFALVDRSQTTPHAQCKAALPTLSLPLLTTWPCLAEAMYLAGAKGGWPMQRLVWQYITDGTLRIHPLSEAEITRMQTLMEKYKDTPMDFADASLVAAAETLGLRRIFTLDSDFYIYRLADGSAFEIVP